MYLLVAPVRQSREAETPESPLERPRPVLEISARGPSLGSPAAECLHWDAIGRRPGRTASDGLDRERGVFEFDEAS